MHDFGVPGQHDRFPGGDQAGGAFVERLRNPELGRNRLIAQMAPVIAGHRQNLRGGRGNENLDLLQREAGLRLGPFAEQVSRKLADLIALEQTVSGRLPFLKAEEPDRLGGINGIGCREQEQSGADQS